VENKKKENDFDYNPSGDFMERVRKRQIKEKERYEAAKEAANKVLSQKSYSIGHLPGGTITTTSYANSAININGDPVNGSMRVDVPLIVNGRNVMEELDEMRDVLLLLKRDVDMESKYPRLKELKDEYEAALAKYKTFEALK
jgi:hypothetical protein